MNIFAKRSHDKQTRDEGLRIKQAGGTAVQEVQACEQRIATPQLSVIVPTRNESANIVPLLEAVGVALKGITAEIIIVDDSDDETPAIITRVAQTMNTSLIVRLMHRPRGPERAGGLATAVSLGMSQATAKYLAVIDADLQHPPERLRALFDEAVAADADVVMATRYRPGGSYEGLDGVSRRMISVGLKWVAKLVFPDQLLSVSDPLGGFFLVRRSIIEGVTLRPIGYKISLELLIRCPWVRLVEVPYHFHARNAGESKSDFKQGVMVLRHMGRLVREVPGAARFWKFCAVGASGLVVNFVLFWLALQAHYPKWPAWAIVTEISVLSNFVLNSVLTWRDVAAQRRSDWLTRAVLYHGAVLPSLTLNFLVFAALTLNDYQTPFIAQVAGVAASLLLSYWMARRFVFAPREEWSRLKVHTGAPITLEAALRDELPIGATPEARLPREIAETVPQA